MRLNDIVKGLVLGTALYAAGCGGSDDRTGCQNDNDCRAPRICVSGSCRNPNGNEDGGQQVRDSGRPIEDSGQHNEDREQPVEDSGSPVEDSRPPPPECNPASGCSDRGCVFYDDFSGSSLDTECKWEIEGGGSISVSGGNLHISGDNRVIGRVGSTTICSSWDFETRVRLENSGEVEFIVGDFVPNSLDSIYLGFNTISDHDVYFDCGGFAPSPHITDINVYNWNAYKVEVRDRQATLFVNGSTRRTLNDCYVPIDISSFYIGGYHPDKNLTVDYVKEICR